MFNLICEKMTLDNNLRKAHDEFNTISREDIVFIGQ